MKRLIRRSGLRRGDNDIGGYVRSVMGMPENLEKIREKIRKAMREEFGIVPRVKVLTFGGGAGKVAEYISSRKLTGVKVVAVNVDERVKELSVDMKMWAGKEVLGTHNDTEGEVRVGEYIVNRTKSWIIEEARDSDAVVLIAALGGGMGTGGVVEAMRILKEKVDKPMMAIFILPFSVEADRRKKAMNAINTVIDENLGTYIAFDSDTMLTQPNLTIAAGYNAMYEKIYGIVKRIANITRVTIERKFDELYLSTLDLQVEEKYQELLNREETLTA